MSKLQRPLLLQLLELPHPQQQQLQQQLLVIAVFLQVTCPRQYFQELQTLLLDLRRVLVLVQRDLLQAQCRLQSLL
jgi:hypothetical protein